MPAINLHDPFGNPYAVKVYPNQKAIYIHRDKGINFWLNQEAMKKLSADAYLLYMYLLTKKENRVWVLSSQEVFKHTALKKRTYMKAVAELQEKKYLIPGPIEGLDKNVCTYHFWESPKVWDDV